MLEKLHMMTISNLRELHLEQQDRQKTLFRESTSQ